MNLPAKGREGGEGGGNVEHRTLNVEGIQNSKGGSGMVAGLDSCFFVSIRGNFQAVGAVRYFFIEEWWYVVGWRVTVRTWGCRPGLRRGGRVRWHRR